jgi:hypothetical protein
LECHPFSSSVFAQDLVVSSGRKNELTSLTRVSLNRIANRIDRGYNIEVRVATVEPDGKSAQGKAGDEHIAAIRAATKNMQFMKLEGKPILQLPEASVKEDTKKG